ncbi:MAG: family 10 glycosylhydrolase [Mucilaginibacter polytrichastri]|nr:family 10 glycosylhydrolase [Mucilaginibacter polytrichastri]
MNTRRRFLKSGLLAGTSALVLPATATATVTATAPKPLKHWVWINPDKKDSKAELQKTYAKYYRAGIRGIFFEADSELHYRTAKAAGLEAHRWMWTMNRGEKSLLESHPEWYAISRKGDSCATKPPYVDYYRWLCPSKPEVKKYLEDDVKSILAKDYIDGIHLDYVRYCDVILAVNLWDKYKIEQTSEKADYDFCYCETCQAKFKAWKNRDITKVQYPDQDLSWRLYRYHAITKIVNSLAKIAHDRKKPITAAVFPTPEVARRLVRQDWTNWNLDGICPMIYHGFYKEDVAWIGDAVEEGIHFLNGRFPLYAGLYLPDFNGNIPDVQKGMEYALKNGAAGISIFGKVDDEILGALVKASATRKG